MHRIMNYWIFKFFYKKRRKNKQTKETHHLPFTPLQHKTVSWQVFFISEKIVILGSKIKDVLAGCKVTLNLAMVYKNNFLEGQRHEWKETRGLLSRHWF